MKTAFFASDPNLGRILAAIGYAGVDDLDADKIDLYLDDVLVARHGGRNPEYQEEDGQRVMKQSEITVRVELDRGDGSSDHLDLRLVARLREHQRRLPLMTQNELEQILQARRSAAGAARSRACRRRRATDWKRAIAFRWRKRATGTRLSAAGARTCTHPRSPTCTNIEPQKSRSSRTPGSSSTASPPTTCC